MLTPDFQPAFKLITFMREDVISEIYQAGMILDYNVVIGHCYRVYGEKTTLKPYDYCRFS